MHDLSADKFDLAEPLVFAYIRRDSGEADSAREKETNVMIHEGKKAN